MICIGEYFCNKKLRFCIASSSVIKVRKFDAFVFNIDIYITVCNIKIQMAGIFTCTELSYIY